MADIKASYNPAGTLNVNTEVPGVQVQGGAFNQLGALLAPLMEYKRQKMMMDLAMRQMELDQSRQAFKSSQSYSGGSYMDPLREPAVSGPTHSMETGGVGARAQAEDLVPEMVNIGKYGYFGQPGVPNMGASTAATGRMIPRSVAYGPSSSSFGYESPQSQALRAQGSIGAGVTPGQSNPGGYFSAPSDPTIQSMAQRNPLVPRDEPPGEEPGQQPKKGGGRNG